MKAFEDWTPEMVETHNAKVKAKKVPDRETARKIGESTAILSEQWPGFASAGISINKQPEDRMNKTEARFAEMILEPLRLAGQIKKWEFEPFNFRVAEGRFYKPDFGAWHFDGTITVIEIKAYELHRDTVTKLKVIQERYGTPHFRFKLFQWTGGEWVQKA